MNIFYYHWLIKKLLWASGSAEQSKVGIPSRDRREEKAESERHHVAAEGDRHARTLLANREPHGKLQNNSNGLI